LPLKLKLNLEIEFIESKKC